MNVVKSCLIHSPSSILCLNLTYLKTENKVLFSQADDAMLRTNDHYFSLTDQLNLGVRSVELDTHQVEVTSPRWYECSMIAASCNKAKNH